MTSSASTTIRSDTGNASSCSGDTIPWVSESGCILFLLNRGKLDHFNEPLVCRLFGSLHWCTMTKTIAPWESLKGMGCRRPRFRIPRAACNWRTAQRSLWRNWTAGEDMYCSVAVAILLMCFQVQATLASQTKSEPILLEWESDTSTMGIWSSTVVRILSSLV